MLKCIAKPIMIALAVLLAVPQVASAHFIWITVKPEKTGSAIKMFLNEEPEPGGPEFLKSVKDVKPTVDGQPLNVTIGEETVNSEWGGKLPSTIDAESDLGVNTRDGKSYRLYYTARAQSGVLPADTPITGDKLRVRLIEKDGKPQVQVLYEGKPVSKARLHIYPENNADPIEAQTDEAGLATVDGLAEGKTALWANHTDKTAGEAKGKSYEETRYYATLTVVPEAKAKTDAQASHANGTSEPAVCTAFASMSEPAVNSFGGAVVGDWLYVYSGHIGKTHEYNVETTSKHFRRLNLKDRTTWEDLPMDKDVQGVALVTDGKALYRLGGMSAKNEVGKPHDLHSVADFSRFDPESKVWTALPSLPTARSTHDAVVIGNLVYAVGGWTMKGATEESEYLEDAYVFDLTRPEDGWKSIGQPFHRRALSAATANGKLYVLGGLNDEFKVERTVNVYDPATKSWTTGPELPDSGKNDGFGTSAFGVDNHVYYSGAAGRIYRLSDKGDTWETVGAWALPRITHRLLPGPDHALLAVGGNSKGKQTPVIEAITLPASQSHLKN